MSEHEHTEPEPDERRENVDDVTERLLDDLGDSDEGDEERSPPALGE